MQVSFVQYICTYVCTYVQAHTGQTGEHMTIYRSEQQVLTMAQMYVLR